MILETKNERLQRVPWKRILFEKIIFTKLFKVIEEFYENRSSLECSQQHTIETLFRASWIQWKMSWLTFKH